LNRRQIQRDQKRTKAQCAKLLALGPTDPRLRAELEKGAAHGFARSARSRSVDGVRLLSIDGGPWVKVG